MAEYIKKAEVLDIINTIPQDLVYEHIYELDGIHIDIVTCGECKHTDTQPLSIDSREKEARNLFCGKMLKFVDMDWFCADGERRTE